MVCQPCCFTSKLNEDNKPIIKSNYVRNMLFCKGKIKWSEYLKRVENEEKTENYISTNESQNRKDTYGKMPQLLHGLFNNYDKLYNMRNNKDIDLKLFSNFKSNLLKSPGFVLKGYRIEKNILIDILLVYINI